MCGILVNLALLWVTDYGIVTKFSFPGKVIVKNLNEISRWG